MARYLVAKGRKKEVEKFAPKQGFFMLAMLMLFSTFILMLMVFGVLHVVFAQLRARERRRGRVGSLFFWRDRTREVDFVVDVAGKLELFEAKWNEVPTVADSVNLEFVRNVVGTSRIANGAVVCRTPKSSPTTFGYSLWSTSDRFACCRADEQLFVGLDPSCLENPSPEVRTHSPSATTNPPFIRKKL